MAKNQLKETFVKRDVLKELPCQHRFHQGFGPMDFGGCEGRIFWLGNMMEVLNRIHFGLSKSFCWNSRKKYLRKLKVFKHSDWCVWLNLCAFDCSMCDSRFHTLDPFRMMRSKINQSMQPRRFGSWLVKEGYSNWPSTSLCFKEQIWAELHLQEGIDYWW